MAKQIGWVLVLCSFAGAVAQAADPAAALPGVKVLPKRNAVVKVGNTIIQGPSTPTNQRLDLPWIVQNVNGTWLWVGGRRKGWVQRSEVVTADEAPQYYTSIINRRENEAWAYNMRAMAWQHKGDLRLAIADYELLKYELLKTIKPTVTASSVRGTFVHNKQYEKAIADYNQAIRLDPNYAHAYSGRAIVWGDKKEYDKAIADYDEAIRLDPTFVLAYNNRGSVWNQKQEYDKAIADCDNAIRLDPTYALAYSNRGVAWRNKKEYDKAIADCDQAIRLDPTYALAYNNRGLAWADKKEYDRAIADYNQAIRWTPTYTIGYDNHRKEFVWVNIKEYDKAIADHKHVFLSDPDQANAYNNRGNAWSNKKEYDRAIADYNQASYLYPSLASPYYGEACCYSLQGKTDLAFENLEHALKVGFSDFASLRSDSSLDSIHNDPRFDRLLKTYSK